MVSGVGPRNETGSREKDIGWELKAVLHIIRIA